VNNHSYFKFVITVLILQEHLQASPWKMTLTSTYLSTRTDILNIGITVYFPCKNFVTLVCWHYSNIKVLVHPLWNRELDLMKPSLRAIFKNKSLCCLIWPKKVTLLWLLICSMCYSPFSMGQNLTFCKKLWLSRRSYSSSEGRNCQIGRIFRDNCSEE
jgi:hypothetical protein